MNSYWTNSWTRLKTQKRVVVALWTLLFLMIMAAIGPLISSYTYYETHLPLKNMSPSLQFWFGTDDLGRDMFTRLWWGARISLFVGMTAAVIDLIVGVIFGSVAGLNAGNKIDETMMRAADIIYSIPYLLVVILLTVILGTG